MKKYILSPHISSENHGNEAINVSTSQILRKYDPNAYLTLAVTYEVEETPEFESFTNSKYDKIVNMQLPHLDEKSVELKIFKFYKNVLHHRQPLYLWFRQTKKKYAKIFRSHDVFLSIGGDNYCYGERPLVFYVQHQIAKKCGEKTFLWGCSIEPSIINKEMLRDLKLYDRIFCRESLTYDALKTRGLENISLCADPAFTLKPIQTSLQLENVIGINVSSLVLSYVNDSSIVIESYGKLIQNILRDTDCDIALIPHVTVDEEGNDLKVLRLLKECFPNEKRITLYDQYMNCCELKALISQCRILVTARTHASIAAYSSCVPTLVCGYSIKAKGIAKDLFGTYENYVVSVQDIDDCNLLSNAFKWIYDNESEIREHLRAVMPDYVRKAWEAGEELVSMCGEEREKLK